VLLPPIIFQGGFSVQRKMFFQNIFPIMGLALIGTFFSTVVIAILMFIFTNISENGWSVIESLVYFILNRCLDH
jgi:NhaP-type Na+/H+ or K+/H+ antiporter